MSISIYLADRNGVALDQCVQVDIVPRIGESIFFRNRDGVLATIAVLNIVHQLVPEQDEYLKPWAERGDNPRTKAQIHLCLNLAAGKR